MVVLVVVSLLTPSPDKQTQDFVEHVRYPYLAGDTVETTAR
jgi:cation/acetate symporter